MAAREMNPNPSELSLRLEFNNGVLSKTQENDGLKHSWVLLKPHFQIICDVVSYILHSFDLNVSCPHGIILSKKGFVLPEFESISILRDEDLISVKRKETILLDAPEAVKEAMAFIEDGIVEKLPSSSRVKLLANEELNKETGGHRSESEKDEDERVKSTSPVQTAPNGDLASKKRKSSSKLESANELDENKDDTIQASAMPDKNKEANAEKDVWEEIIEALSAKKARLLQEDNWNKKETGAKWPSTGAKWPSTEAVSAQKAQLIQEDNWNKKETGALWSSSWPNQVQNDAKKVASEPSIQKPPTPGLGMALLESMVSTLPANGEKDVWEEITEAASTKKARLMQEDNWNKKETGAKWPSSSYNQVQDDAEKVASEPSNQKPPTPGLANSEKDVWEEITEAASAKKAQLMQENNWNKKKTGMQENNWNKKKTGAKWPPSWYDEVEAKWPPPTPGLGLGLGLGLGMTRLRSMSSTLPSNGEKDVWEEITEAASAKKALLMKENNWNKKKTGAKKVASDPSFQKPPTPGLGMARLQDDAKKVASNPSIQKPPNPGLVNVEKDLSEELTKATSAKKAQLMQEDMWNKEDTAAAMILQQLKKQCHWPRAVNEQSQLAKPSESARSIRAQTRAQARALTHPNPSRCPAKQGSDQKLPLIEPTMAELRMHKAENGVGQLDTTRMRDFNGARALLEA